MPEQKPKDPELPSNTKRKKTHFTRLSTTQLLQNLDKIAGPGAEDEKKRRVMVYTQREKNIRRDAMRREKKRARRERSEKKERKKRGKLVGGEGGLGGILRTQGPNQVQTQTPISKYTVDQNPTKENVEMRNLNVNKEIEMIDEVKEVKEIKSANFRLPIRRKNR